MSLKDDRVLFTIHSCQLILWINQTQWAYGKVECFEGEGFIAFKRAVKDGVHRMIVTDAVHIPTSRHYQGLAKDLCVFIDGEYITDGNHPIWRDIDKKAQEIHRSLSLGVEFHDANHLSWAEGDQK